MRQILTLSIFSLSLLMGELSALKLESVIAMEHPTQKEALTVDLNLHNGKVLVLSDGSTWEVAPQDLETSGSWIFPSPLTIEKSNNTSYPYKIINQTTNSSVLVRPIANQS